MHYFCNVEGGSNNRDSTCPANNLQPLDAKNRNVGLPETVGYSQMLPLLRAVRVSCRLSHPRK